MGRPKGSKNKKKFYKDKEQIKEIFTELKPFFDIKNGEQSGMKEMTRCFDSLNLTERKVFNRNLRYNAKFSYLDQLSELLVACFFNCKNPFQYYHSKVRKTLEGCGKSTLNNFLNNDYIDWRAVCDRFFKRIAEDFQTISQIEEQDEEEARRLKGESAPSVKPQRYRVGIVDDTDDKHFGKKFELGGKIFSHTEKKMILGHKILLFTINDGISTLIKDLAIVGEKGSDGNQCLTQEEIEERYTKEREPDCPGEERAQEQMKSKMDISKEMLQRAVEQGEHLDYFLGDSWFGCPSLALYVLELNAGIHFLGMTKKNRTQYIIKNGDEEERICATGLIQKFEKTEHNKYDRSLKYHHIDVDAFIEDKEKKLVPVKLFFVRGRKRDGYSVILTTDTSLDFRKVIEIYGYRWSIEVAIRDLKQHLCLTKCQARNFTGHISHTSICIIRYNLLSMAMRRGHYKTIGGLFRDIQDDCMELTVIEKFRILFWEMIDHLQNYIESADVIEDFLLSLTTINSKFKLITDYKYRYRESS